MASRPSTSLADMEMIRRLKRLEKFELQQSLKAKIKPKLINNTNEAVAGNLFQDETTGMDLSEMTKHMTVKVSKIWLKPMTLLGYVLSCRKTLLPFDKCARSCRRKTRASVKASTETYKIKMGKQNYGLQIHR